MENTRRELRGRKLTKGLKTPQQASIIIYLFKTSLEGSPNGTLFFLDDPHYFFSSLVLVISLGSLPLACPYSSSPFHQCITIS